LSPKRAPVLVALVLGFGISFLGSVPMTGPLALLVLDRVIVAQRASALWIALAGALVEGGLAAGVATFLPLVLAHSNTILVLARVSGALVITAVGVTLVLRPGVLEAIKTDRTGQSFLAGFLATALNPTLLATWTVTVTALDSNDLIEGGYRTGLAFGAGVAAGALGWFAVVLLLSRGWSLARLTKHRAALGRAVGVVLMLLGAVLFIRVAI
jgi:threonine/homoserine/homoserine lactone efflux protein